MTASAIKKMTVEEFLDSGLKFHHYFSLQSIRHYLVIDPVAKAVMHHCRGKDGEIISAIIREGVFELTPPGLTVRYDDFFQ